MIKEFSRSTAYINYLTLSVRYFYIALRKLKYQF